MEDPLDNPKLQINVDEEEWIELNQEMFEPRMRVLSSHYHENKFRTIQRILETFFIVSNCQGHFSGSGLDNLSFGVGEVPPTAIVSAVAGMNFSLD